MAREMYKTTVETRSLRGGCGLAGSDQIIRSRACVQPENSERKERNSNESTSSTLSFSRDATAEMQAISARLPQTSYSLVIGLRQCIVMLSSAAAADVTLVDWLTAMNAWTKPPAELDQMWHALRPCILVAPIPVIYNNFIITFVLQNIFAIPQMVKFRTMRLVEAIVAIARPTIIYYSWIFSATFRARYTFFSTVRIQSAQLLTFMMGWRRRRHQPIEQCVV